MSPLPAGDPTPWSLAVTDARAVLGGRAAEPGDREELVELLAFHGHLARFPHRADSPLGDVEAALAGVRPEALAGAVGACVEVPVWEADLEHLRGLPPGPPDSPARGPRYEALRLFRLLDRWRLALLAARRRGEGKELRDLAEQVAERLVTPLLVDPAGLEPVAPYAARHLQAFDPALPGRDPELARLSDVHHRVCGKEPLH